MRITHLLFLFSIQGLLLFFSGCKDVFRHTKSPYVSVVCTTGMIADAVREVGGKHVKVIGLMGPGVDPHLYRARPSDMYHVSHADIIFYNGLHLEGKMIDIFQHLSKERPCIALGDLLDTEQLLPTGFDAIYDPHIWHDVLLWSCVVRKIIDTLSHIDPKHEHAYRLRGKAYIKSLKEIDAYIRQRVHELPDKKRILVTAHDAFSYFGRAYGFSVIGLQGVSTDVQIGIQDIQSLVDFIIEKNIPVMFIESSVIARNLQAVQQAAASQGHVVELVSSLYSDALGDDASYASTYIGMVRKNIDTIVDALL